MAQIYTFIDSEASCRTAISRSEETYKEGTYSYIQFASVGITVPEFTHAYITCHKKVLQSLL